MKPIKTGKFTRIQSRLISEEKLPVGYAAVLTSQALTQFDPRVKEGVELWAENSLPEDFEVNGMKLTALRRNYGCSDFLALCILNTALTNPECFTEAVFRLRRVLTNVDK